MTQCRYKKHVSLKVENVHSFQVSLYSQKDQSTQSTPYSLYMLMNVTTSKVQPCNYIILPHPARRQDYFILQENRGVFSSARGIRPEITHRTQAHSRTFVFQVYTYGNRDITNVQKQASGHAILRATVRTKSPVLYSAFSDKTYSQFLRQLSPLYKMH